MNDYKFQQLRSFKTTDSFTNDLYQALKLEVAGYMSDIQMKLNEKMASEYDYLYINHLAEINVLSRVCTILADDTIANLGEYVDYFIKTFDKSLFSEEHIKLTQQSLRALRKINVLINRLKIDILVKSSKDIVKYIKEPYMAIILYFDNVENKVYNNFIDFLNECVNCVNKVL